MKVGRNDPCTCGSGTKYKQCCLIGTAASEDDGLELRWQQQKRVTEGLTADLLRFAINEFGREAFDEAWTKFTLGKEEVFDAETRHMQVFAPWFFYDWTPEAVERGGQTTAAERSTVTGAFLRKRGRHLDLVLRDYLEACIG
ncbi:MAG: SEC-C metal-binding domain-containing protein, partial [Casimicrobiaceae bacterium]